MQQFDINCCIFYSYLLNYTVAQNTFKAASISSDALTQSGPQIR